MKIRLVVLPILKKMQILYYQLLIVEIFVSLTRKERFFKIAAISTVKQNPKLIVL